MTFLFCMQAPRGRHQVCVTTTILMTGAPKLVPALSRTVHDYERPPLHVMRVLPNQFGRSP